MAKKKEIWNAEDVAAEITAARTLQELVTFVQSLPPKVRDAVTAQVAAKMDELMHPEIERG